jgi:23S rRNA (cytosine1962-C5)-methyltransferase
LKITCGPLTPQAKAALEETSTIAILENQIHYKVDIVEGHKTGFYVDQRENRALVKQLARGSVLNCFSYTGGFSLSALKAGASRVVSVDSSASALVLGQENAKLNGLDVRQSEWIEADVFKQLRAFRANGETFDLIILDPPKFAPNAASVERACRAYKDINILGMQLLNPGGDLLTFSCSGAVSTDLFRKVVAGAGADANIDMQVISNLSAGLDHPIDLAFPEGEYLKGLHLRRSE